MAGPRGRSPRGCDRAGEETRRHSFGRAWRWSAPGRALEQIYGAEIVELFCAIKRAFDPSGIFNPGVILPSGEPPISRLKVGPDAAVIPEDIQRDCERSS